MSPLSKRRVLCAEPHNDICELVTSMLEREGHEVESAATLRDCLELASRERFDLYMLDDDYIDGTGIELCKELRALTPETPILFFSSAAFERDIQRGLEAGAQLYLTKPDDIFEIVQAVNSVLMPKRAGATPRDAE